MFKLYESSELRLILISDCQAFSIIFFSFSMTLFSSKILAFSQMVDILLVTKIDLSSECQVLSKFSSFTFLSQMENLFCEPTVVHFNPYVILSDQSYLGFVLRQKQCFLEHASTVHFITNQKPQQLIQLLFLICFAIFLRHNGSKGNYIFLVISFAIARHCK